MAIDSSIALGVKPIQIESPVNQLANVLQLQGAQQANQLNAMKMAQVDQANQRQNALLRLSQGMPAEYTDEQRLGALRGGGFWDEADKLATSLQNRRKIDSEASVKDAEAVDKRLGFSRAVLSMVKTPEQFMAWHEGNHSDPILGKLLASRGITPESANKNIQARLAEPGGLEKLIAESALGMDEFIKQNKPTLTTQNLEDRSQVLSTPALGFDPTTVVRSDVIGQSANNAATNATSRANNADTNATTRRGQDMTDARAKETLAQADRHFTTTNANGKALTEGQSKAALFGSRMQDAHDTLTQLGQAGTTTSVPGATSNGMIGSAVNPMLSSNQQQLAQAKRDFVNAVLRRESGAAISPTEFQNAEKQYFPQVGDSADTIAQKARNREVAIRGMLVEIPEAQRDKVVSDIRGGKKSSASIPPTNAKGWKLHVDANGNKAYVGPNNEIEEVK